MDMLRALHDEFMRAMATHDVEEMKRLTSLSFQADFGREILEFDEFVQELARQRAAFSDLGKNMQDLQVTVEGRVVRAVFEMIVTFNGRLYSATKKNTFVEPTNKRIIIPTISRTTFTNTGQGAKIASLQVESRLDMTIGQMF